MLVWGWQPTEIKEVNLPTSLTHAYIRAFSDLHLGDVNFNEKKFLEDRKWVEDTPNCYIKSGRKTAGRK